MVPWAILAEGRLRLQHRRVLWFVDNTAALHCFIRGSSRNPAVARAVTSAHLHAYAWRFLIWFEFVESGSNWADDLSRMGEEDRFSREHGFEVLEMCTPLRMFSDTPQQHWAAVLGAALG